MTKIRDMLDMGTDMDILQNVTDDVLPAFCGPLELTEEGRREFADVLDLDIELHTGARVKYGVVQIDGKDWKRRLSRLSTFFWSAAGYCSQEDWDRWFVEPDCG